MPRTDYKLYDEHPRIQQPFWRIQPVHISIDEQIAKTEEVDGRASRVRWKEAMSDW